MKKVIKLTESDLMRLVKRVISEQSMNTVGNSVRSAALKGGIAKAGSEIPQELINWLKENNIKNGQWSKDLKNPEKILVSYLPDGLLGTSKLHPIMSIYKPSTVTNDKGTWEFNGTTVVFK